MRRDTTSDIQGLHSSRRVRPRDVGSTFIEILVSVVLLGTVSVAVLAALSATIVGARTGDEVAKSQASLAEAVDFLTDTDPQHVAYRSCASLTTAALIQAYQTDLDTRFGAGAIEVVGVRFWDRTAGGGSGGFASACRFNVGDRIQEISLASVVNNASRSATAVKRPVDVPTVDIVAAPPAPPYAGGSGQATVSLTPGINGP